MKKTLLITGLILIIVVAIFVVNIIIFTKSSQEISAGMPISDNLAENPALLVIDLQEATTGSVAIKHEYQNKASNLYFAVNSVIDTCAAKEIPVIYIRNEVSNPWINIINSSMKKGTIGTELDPRLHIASDNIFSKEKQDAFSNPELDKFLVKKKINTIYITGLDAAYCVKSTALAALNRKYKVVMISDAIISTSESLKQSSLEYLINNGAALISSDKF